MGYATLDTVKGLMAQLRLDTTSKPSGAQAEAIIDAVAAEIDSVLAGVGVDVPVTAPAYFLDYLAQVNAYGATGQIIQSMFPQAGGNVGESSAAELWLKLYRDALKAFEHGDRIPSESKSSASSSVLPATYLTRNFDTDLDLGTNAEPTFKRGQVF